MKGDSIKLSKNEMIMVLHDQELELEKLRERIIALETELNCKEIKISEAGSLADAAVKVSGVFEAAEEAAKIYIENLRRNSEQTEGVLEDIRKRADSIISDAQLVASKRLGAVDAEINAKWDAFYEKLAILCTANPEFRAVVEEMGIKLPE